MSIVSILIIFSSFILSQDSTVVNDIKKFPIDLKIPKLFSKPLGIDIAFDPNQNKKK